MPVDEAAPVRRPAGVPPRSATAARCRGGYGDLGVRDRAGGRAWAEAHIRWPGGPSTPGYGDLGVRGRAGGRARAEARIRWPGGPSTPGYGDPGVRRPGWGRARAEARRGGMSAGRVHRHLATAVPSLGGHRCVRSRPPPGSRIPPSHPRVAHPACWLLSPGRVWVPGCGLPLLGPHVGPGALQAPCRPLGAGSRLQARRRPPSSPLESPSRPPPPGSPPEPRPAPQGHAPASQCHRPTPQGHLPAPQGHGGPVTVTWAGRSRRSPMR